MTTSSTPADSTQGSQPGNTPVGTTLTNNPPTPTVEDMGTITFNSPSHDRHNQRRDSLITAKALAAMRLSNEVIGDRGLGYPVDGVTRTLFTNPILNPVNASTTTVGVIATTLRVFGNRQL